MTNEELLERVDALESFALQLSAQTNGLMNIISTLLATTHAARPKEAEVIAEMLEEMRQQPYEGPGPEQTYQDVLQSFCAGIRRMN